jgi:hypothetical protein
MILRRKNNKERQGEDGFGDPEADAAYDDEDFPPPRETEEAEQGIFRRMTSGITSFLGRIIPFRRTTRRRPGLFGRRDPEEEGAVGSPEEFFADFPTAQESAQLRNAGFEDDKGAQQGTRGKRRRQRNKEGRRNGSKRRQEEGGQNRRQRPGRYPQNENDDYGEDVDDYGTASSRPLNNQQGGERPSPSYDYSEPADTSYNRPQNNGGEAAEVDPDADPELDNDNDPDDQLGFNDPYLSGPDETEGQQQQPQGQQQQSGFGAQQKYGTEGAGYAAESGFSNPAGNNPSYFDRPGATDKGGLSVSGFGPEGGLGEQLLAQPYQGGSGGGTRATGASQHQVPAKKKGPGAAAAGDDPSVDFPPDVERDFEAYGDKDETFFNQKKK